MWRLISRALLSAFPEEQCARAKREKVDEHVNGTDSNDDGYR